MNKYLLWASVVIAVFLIGFAPLYIRTSRCEAELRDSAQKLRGADVRDLIGLAYIQAEQKNYGLAAQTTTQYFDRLREAAAATPDTQRKNMLQQALAARDAVTAALAKGDPGVVGQLQDLFLKTRAATLP